ncbi:hypothetical protein [Bartonella sp. WD16.2]|uniref:hypothetical protein n=1 Tax=Bartonella sp. WD16.2 TaxID=1933904 RepID=UPI00099AF072|nr:hypothetical protein [Bartonella sp. WD16.2]AQX19537.1 hypothetical protein BWD162_004060 [Bartonella sp. WD16.2]
MLSSLRLISRLFAVVFIIVLVGCQFSSQPMTKHNDYTRVTEISSEVFYYTNNPLILLEMRAKWISNQGYVIDIVTTSIASDDLNLNLAWSQNRNYRYVSGGKSALVCVVGCTVSEKGRLFIPEDEFRTYAHTGFTFKLIGRSNSVDGFLNARAFQRVLYKMQTLPRR